MVYQPGLISAITIVFGKQLEGGKSRGEVTFVPKEESVVTSLEDINCKDLIQRVMHAENIPHKG